MLITYLTSVADSTASSDPDDLLAQIAQGDTGALQQLYNTLSRELYSYALSVVKHPQDAQDVLHDSFLAIVKGGADYQRRGKSKAWIYTIVHNRCMQVLRSRQKSVTISTEEWLALVDEKQSLSLETRLTLTACMDRLSDEERRIVILHTVSGFRHREIAAVLEMPLSTVLSKYNRALKKLRVMLEEKSDTP